MPPFHNKIPVLDQGQDVGNVQGGWDRSSGISVSKSQKGFCLKEESVAYRYRYRNFCFIGPEESLSLALLPPLTAESSFQRTGPHAQGESMSAPSKNRTLDCVSSLGNWGGVLFSTCGSEPPSSPTIPQYLWLLPALPAFLSTYGSSQLAQHRSVSMAPPSSPHPLP